MIWMDPLKSGSPVHFWLKYLDPWNNCIQTAICSIWKGVQIFQLIINPPGYSSILHSILQVNVHALEYFVRIPTSQGAPSNQLDTSYDLSENSSHRLITEAATKFLAL